MTRKTEVIRHVTEDELEQLYRKEKNAKIKERLHSILLLYRGYEALEVAEILRRGYSFHKGGGRMPGTPRVMKV